jgi:16S rRNA (guanine527-N7)-methyltransferase
VTEDEARAWLGTHCDVPRETWDRLERYIALLLEGMGEQNLIAASTVPNLWARHIVDSAQLLLHTENAGEGPWVDLGSGAGLPGVVVACLTDYPVIMIENRRKRIDFLRHVIESSSPCAAAVISARAYAPLPQLLASATHLANRKTIWVLPKGRGAQNELEAVRPAWQGVFHVEPSVTDPDSSIIVARGVAPAGTRKSRS